MEKARERNIWTGTFFESLVIWRKAISLDDRNLLRHYVINSLLCKMSGVSIFYQCDLIGCLVISAIRNYSQSVKYLNLSVDSIGHRLGNRHPQNDKYAWNSLVHQSSCLIHGPSFISYISYYVMVFTNQNLVCYYVTVTTNKNLVCYYVITMT